MAVITIIPQSQFVSTRDSKFILNGRDFRFFGFNAYYLQTNAADSGKRYIVDDVFSFAKNNGFKVIRTWAFNNSDSIYPGVISAKPNEIREQGLAGLDYVVAKAKENELMLILTLANNEPAYGGIEQYIKWANQYLSSAQAFSHQHFYSEDSIINWYKFHVSSILNRVNTFTGIAYKDEPAIFSFELINEASNPGSLLRSC